MRNCFLPLIAVALCVPFSACQKGDDEPPIVVNEKKYDANHPKNDVSGDIAITEREYTLKLQAPTPAWSVFIESVYVVGDEIWVISKLNERQGGAVAQVVTEISDSVKLTLPQISPVYYVVGEQIGPDQVGVKFIDSLDEIQSGLDDGERVWVHQRL